MQCPVCKKDMVVLELEQVEIDHCLQCGGIWLDRGELEIMAHHSGCEDVLCASEKAAGTNGRKLKCPYCTRVMSLVEVPAESKITLDACPQRHGWWCDKGELEQFLRAEGSARVAAVLQEMFKHEAHKQEGRT